MAETTAVQKQEQSPIRIEGGLMKLETLGDAYRFAQYVVKSELAPKSFNTPEKVLIAVQQGAELGLKPMQALQGIAVIGSRPSVWGKTAVGLVLNSSVCERLDFWFEIDGKRIDEAEIREFPDSLTAVCLAKRRDKADTWIRKFTVADAKKAGLWGKNTWASYPKDMLRYKAFARASALFGDILLGLQITEDIREVAPEREEITAEHPNTPDPLLDEAVAEVVEAHEQKIDPDDPLGTKQGDLGL